MPSCTLKWIPEELYKQIAKEQLAIKEKKDVKVYSIEQTILHMLREYLKLKYEAK